MMTFSIVPGAVVTENIEQHEQKQQQYRSILPGAGRLGRFDTAGCASGNAAICTGVLAANAV